MAELAALEPIFTQTRRKRELPQYTSGIIHLALYLLDMVEEKDDWAACRKVLHFAMSISFSSGFTQRRLLKESS